MGKVCSKRIHREQDGKPEGNRPVGRPRRRWKDDFIMDCREME
jgi:hypothetical protein